MPWRWLSRVRLQGMPGGCQVIATYRKLAAFAFTNADAATDANGLVDGRSAVEWEAIGQKALDAIAEIVSGLPGRFTSSNIHRGE